MIELREEQADGVHVFQCFPYQNPDTHSDSETYADFKARRKRNNARVKGYLRGSLIWDSRTNGPIVKKNLWGREISNQEGYADL